MKKIKLNLILSVYLLLNCNSLNAAVYTDLVGADNTGIGAENPPNDYVGGGALLWSISLDLQLKPTAYTLATGHVWYESTASDIIDPSYVGTGTEFANAFTGYIGGSIDLVLNRPFILGFWLDTVDDSVADIDDVYGWAELEYDGADIYLLRSAISDSGSIEAGVVPEPSSILLLASGTLMLSCRRRRENA